MFSIYIYIYIHICVYLKYIPWHIWFMAQIPPAAWPCSAGAPSPGNLGKIKWYSNSNVDLIFLDNHIVITLEHIDDIAISCVRIMYVYIYIIIIIIIINIYIYGLVFRVPTPPQWYGSPGSTPFPSICKLLAAFLRSSLVFARSLQHFWLPASHLLGTCYLLDDLHSAHTPSKYLRPTYSHIYMCYVT